MEQKNSMHSTFGECHQIKTLLFIICCFFPLHCYAMNLCANVVNSDSNNCDDVHILPTYEIVSYHLHICSWFPVCCQNSGKFSLPMQKKDTIPYFMWKIWQTDKCYHMWMDYKHFVLCCTHVLGILCWDFNQNK